MSFVFLSNLVLTFWTESPSGQRILAIELQTPNLRGASRMPEGFRRKVYQEIKICNFKNLSVSGKAIAHKSLIVNGRCVQTHEEWFVEKLVIRHIVTDVNHRVLS